MKHITLPALFLLLIMGTMAQTPKVLKKTIELAVPGEGGKNGATIVWHPILKRYYAPIAGNEEFQIGVFDEKGKLISNEDWLTLFDTRGLWYNPVTKSLEGNAYADKGWFRLKLDPKGKPTEAINLFEGQNQPSEQSVGSYNAKDNKVYFLSDGIVYKYNLKTGEPLEDAITIHWGQSRSKPIEETDSLDVTISDNYNYTTAIFTGIPGAELALLNIFNNKIELYNLQGYLTKTFSIPDDVALYPAFNFAFANKTWWFFNKETRSWTGYQ